MTLTDPTPATRAAVADLRQRVPWLRPGPDPEQPFDIRDFIDGQAAFYAGTANVIMQLGWPAVGRGVFESKVDDGSIVKVPRKRARTTITYLAVALMGTEDERAFLREEVNRQHRHVRSTEDSPVKYNAFSRDLQLWVAACIAYGTRDFFEALHGPIPEELRPALHTHLGRLATTLQVPEEMWPATEAEFETYWAEAVTKVSFDEDLQRFLIDLLELRQLPAKRQAKLGGFHRWINTGFTPPEMREALGLEWTDADEVGFREKLAKVGACNRRVPRPVRNFPMNLFLWDFRVRRALGKPIV